VKKGREGRKEGKAAAAKSGKNAAPRGGGAERGVASGSNVAPWRKYQADEERRQNGRLGAQAL